MFHQKTGLLLQSTFTVLLCCLFFTHCCRGQSQVIGPSQPIVATLGDDIILPCYLEPAYDATTLTVEWARPDLKPRFIYVSRSGQELEKMKNPSYKERTFMFIDELKHGNISLKISKVKPTDAGRYRCFTIEINKDTFIDLVVVLGAVSQPVTTLAGVDGKGGVELQCESSGWYPEPELLWLDGDGNLLSAGPTETVRGPDDLYTVSSRVTVEKKHNNKFTCRVQQNNINQTRETWIHVPDDFFKVQPSKTSTIVGLAVCLVFSIILLILAVVLFIHTRRQHRTKRREDVQVKSEEDVELMSDNIMSMKTSEKKKQPESKQTKKEYDEIQNQLHQEKEERMKAENEVKILKNQLEKLKEEEVKQKEEQRMKEAEITKLKEKLDMKKTEVENKQTELQSLQKKKKIQEDLKKLNQELKTITEELENSSWFPFLWKKKEDKKRMQTEIEKLNKQLEIKNMEFQEKDEECEEKQVELKKLLDDQQKMETELIEEQQLMKKKYDDIQNQLQQEEEEKMKAENEVKILNSRLEVGHGGLESIPADSGEGRKHPEQEEAGVPGENPHMHRENMQTPCRKIPGRDLNRGPSCCKLQDEKKKLMETEGNVKTLIQNMMKELDETDSQSWQQRHENMTVENQLEELQKKLQENKEQWAETEEKKKTELDQLQDEKKKLMETEGNVKTLIQNMMKELDETDSQSWQQRHENMTVENQLEELQKKLKENKEQWAETEEKKKTERHQLQDEKKKLMETEGNVKTLIQNMMKELDETDSQSWQQRHENMTVENQLEELQKKWMQTVGNLKTELQNMKLELKGPISLEEVNKYYGYIRLKNIAEKDLELRGCKLKLQTTTKGPVTYEIPTSEIQSGGNFSVYIDFTPFGTREQLQITFIGGTGKEYRLQ